MAAPSVSSNEPRPTVRMIAARAGISGPAVSMALRDHPRISEATRKRVLRIAEEMGYRPDPEIAKLMNHLRQRRKPKFRSVITALTSIPEKEERPYNRQMIKGAEARADQLGYRLSILRITPSVTRDHSLQRILRARGVDGLLLLPMRDTVPLTDLLDWSQFSVVAATRGVAEPVFHRVLPHHFGNTLEICDQLERLGYKRIGLVSNRGFDLFTSPGLAAGVVWQHIQGRAEQVTPLLHDGERPAGVKAWFKRERPDAIVARGVPDAEAIVDDLGLKFPGRIGLAVTNLEGSRSFAGMDVHPYDIGATAIEMVHARIQSSQKNVPRLLTETMITGTWIAGPTVRAAADRKTRGR
ncbi:MAG TPA: LacI family DNA-binding transcriptional regulator [Opitutus sp.]|nr:LacI family DNA-binding transcriptional regulator [Opitutus sp.]